MEIILGISRGISRGISGEEARTAYSILAVGNFDGVHLGHRQILETVVRRARQARGMALALTFDPHPMKVLSPERPLHLLTSFEQKARLMAQMGLDRLICIPSGMALLSAVYRLL